MDLAFSTSEIEFRDEIRTWLNEHKPSEKWLAMDTEIGFEQHRTCLLYTSDAADE